MCTIFLFIDTVFFNLIPRTNTLQKKLLGEGQTNIPDDLGIDQSIEKNILKNNEDGTKTVESNHKNITTSTSIVISNKKIFPAQLIIM